MGFIATPSGLPTRTRIVVKVYGKRTLSITSTTPLVLDEWLLVYLVHFAKILYTIPDQSVADRLLGEVRYFADRIVDGHIDGHSLRPGAARDLLLPKADVVVVGERSGGKAFTIDVVGKERRAPMVETGWPMTSTLGEIALSNLALLYHALSAAADENEVFALGMFIRGITKFYDGGGSHRAVTSILEAPEFAMEYVQDAEKLVQASEESR